MNLRLFRYAALPLLLLCVPLAPFRAAEPEAPVQARGELYAYRFEKAAEFYAKATAEDPSDGEAWYGLVRAKIEAHHSKDAYEVADEALRKAPETPGAQCAAGLAMYRRGDIGKAEAYFRSAFKINPEHVGALRGLAMIYSTVSMRRTARELILKAWRNAPDDPDLALAHANTLEGAAHIAALEALLHRLDAASEQAMRLRAHIAADKAVGDLKLRQLVSPYEGSRIKLIQVMNGPQRLRGMGLTVILNQKHKVTLLLDTGASGIAISPKTAQSAGLLQAGDESSEAKGIGDEGAQTEFHYVAQQLRVGDVEFGNYPVSVFRSARTDDVDGLIGADVFQRFMVSIDFPRGVLSLAPRDPAPTEGGEPVDAAKTPPAGFQRAFRFGNHLSVPTSVNGKQSALFLIDSGSSSNLIDTDLARAASSVYGDSRTVVKGIQGKVSDISRADRISLVFAGLRQENPDLIAFSMEKMGDGLGAAMGGVIGMPVLRNLRLTIDYRQGAVQFDYKK